MKPMLWNLASRKPRRVKMLILHTHQIMCPLQVLLHVGRESMIESAEWRKKQTREYEKKHWDRA